MSRDSTIFQKAIGAKRSAQHIHITAPWPLAAMKANPVRQAIRMGEYYRRVNLVAEMRGLMAGGKIAKKEVGGTTFFDNLSEEQLKFMVTYLKDKGGGMPQSDLADQLKLAWVGFRGSDTYDAPDLFGFEVRSIQKIRDEASDEIFLNKIQKSLHADALLWT